MIGRTTVIGFGYRARRGKDTAVAAIVKAYPLQVRRYAFGDALKEEVALALRDQPAMGHLCAWAGVPYDPTASKQRALLQWWGTAYRRAQDTSYWVKRVSEKILREQPRYALISDVRFFNEFELCDYAVRMDRPGFEIEDGSHHISEHRLDALPESAWTRIIQAADPVEVEWAAVSAFRSITGQ